MSAPVIPAWNNTPDLQHISNQTKISVSTSSSSSLCLVPQSPIYQLYAIIVAFYLPLSVILILNAKVYFIARRIIKRVSDRNSTGTCFFLSLVCSTDFVVKSLLKFSGEKESKLVQTLASRY